jgi:hypothetical protein
LISACTTPVPLPSLLVGPFCAASGAMISCGPVTPPAFCAAVELLRFATPTVPIMVPLPEM